MTEPRTSFYRIGKWGALLIIAYFLFTEHRAHMIQILPYLLLLACPLMHFFMHGKHHKNTHHEDHITKGKL
jgi:hypothetical protein